MHSVETKSDFGEHVRHLELGNLHGCEGLSELLALKHVVSGSVEARFSSAHRSPGNTEPGLIEAREWPFKAFHVQYILFWHFHIFKHNHASGGGTEGKFSIDFGI